MLSHNNMRFSNKVAGRTFTAKCGHKVSKGEAYLAFDDYFAYSRIHISNCLSCASLGSRIHKEMTDCATATLAIPGAVKP